MFCTATGETERPRPFLSIIDNNKRKQGDADINELLSDKENSDMELEDKCFEKLKQVFSAKKNWNSKSPKINCVKVVVSGKGKKKRKKC